MTSFLYCSVFLVVSVAGSAFGRDSYEENYGDSGESDFSGSTLYDGYGSDESSSLPNKRVGGFDSDGFVPSIGHNNDYSGFKDGYQGPQSHGGKGAVSFSQVVADHRPVQRVHATHRLATEATNVIEKPLSYPFKGIQQYSQVPISLVPAYNSDQIFPFLPLAPVAPALIAPVKYPVQFFKPISYQPQPKQAAAPVKHEQPDYVLTKVPLVYHATYAETPLGQSGFSQGANNFDQGESHLRNAASEFERGVNSFNQGKSFNAGAQHINSVVTPGTPSHNNLHVPVPLLPTPNPYYNNQHRHQ